MPENLKEARDLNQRFEETVFIDTYTYVLSLMGVNGVKLKDGPKYWKM